MTVRAGQNNFVSGAENMMQGDQVNRDIYVGKTANSMPLKHRVSYEFINGNEALCNQLDLKIWYNHYNGPPSGGYANRDMRLKYNDSLTSLSNLIDSDFIIPHSDDQFDTDDSDGTEQWFYYSITMPSDIAESFQGEVCKFKFIYEAWQDNFNNYGDGGFSDVEEIESTIKAGYWNPPVVLNEFLPNADVYPEFIELYNQTSLPIDLANYYINASGNIINIDSNTTNEFSGGDTIIPANGWLVVTTDNNKLNDASGTIVLYNPNDVEIDSYTYSGGAYNINNNPGWTNNLVAYWPFDNNNVLDISGNNNDGTKHGASFVPGKINQALSFDGLDDYVSIANSDDFDFGYGEFSIEFWIKTSSSLRQWVGTRYENYGPGWGLGTQNNHALGYIRTLESGTNKTEIEGIVAVANDTWHHLIMTRTGDKIKLYTDGNFETEGTLAGSVSNNEPIEIGRISWSNGSQYLNGLIDEVKVYSRALDSDEVTEHYNAVGSGNSVPLDKSYARIPDGSPNWVDPFPTPGGPNILESTHVTPEIDSIFQPEEQDPVKPEPEEEIIDIPEEELVTESEGFSAQIGETASSSEDLIEDLIVDSEEKVATESEDFSAQGGPAVGWEELEQIASSSEEDIFEEINSETEKVINNLINDNIIENNSEEEVATESEGFSAQGEETTSSSEDLIIDSEEENIEEEDQQINDQETEESSDQEDSEDILEKEPKEELKEEEAVEPQKPEEQENNQAEDSDNEVSNDTNNNQENKENNE